MGRLLEEYIASNVPALEDIVRGGIQQPEGATTFPGPQPPAAALQGQAIGPGGAPMGPMASMPPPGAGGINPQAVATPTFDATGGAPQPAIPPVEAQQQPDRSGEFEAGPDSFAGMSNEADPEDIANATKAMEEGGVDIDAEYAKVTGSEPEESADDPEGKTKGEGLTKQEKALILMEFGLNLMAQSGTGEGTLAGDLGKAGGAALTGHMGRKAAQAKQLAAAEDKKLDRELKRAQIKKAGQVDAQLSTDGSGNRILINKQTGESTPVLMDGKPVGADDSDKLDFQLQVEAFEGAYKDQIKDPKELHRRAIAFAKGVKQIAFPELARADAAKAIVKELNEGKNSSQKFFVDGKEKRWKNMTHAEKTTEARRLVDMQMAAAKAGVSSPTDGEDNYGLDDEQVKGMEPNTKYKLSNDKWVAKRNGKLVEVDPPAQ